MKHFFYALTLSLFVFTACQSSKTDSQATSQPKKTNPMELTESKTIQLTEPDTVGDIALLQAMKNRKSDREFKSDNLSLEHLSGILWAANGVNRPNGKRTVPSALGLYPLKTYAVLSNGIYLYDPAKHELQPVVEGDYRNLAGLQPFVETAPLNLVFVADYNVYKERNIPAEKYLYLASLDAGHCTQNVYLYCASENMKAVVRAGAKEKELLALLGLDDNNQFIVAQTIGY